MQAWNECFHLRKSRTPVSPASSVKMLEPKNPWIDKFYVVQERRAMDFDAQKSGKNSSGGRDI